MAERARAAFHRALLWWVGGVAARPWLVVVSALLVTALALTHVARHLGIDTSTTNMISAEVAFRQNDIAFQGAFPEFSDPIVAVIDAPAAEAAERAARQLTQALEADEGRFTAVSFPGGDPFFRSHGLLYLEVDQLADLTDRLVAAQPLLAALAGDPTLRGLAQFLELLAEHPGEVAAAGEIDRLLQAMAEVVGAQLEGRPQQLSWRGLLLPAEAAGTRQLVLAQPRLDHRSLAPAADAIAALRATAAGLGIGPTDGLQLRLTGPAVLDQEELESVASGALIASALTTATVTLLLVWGLGSLRLIGATLLTLACGLIATAAFATLAVGRLNLISVTFAVLFVGLGVDFGIHLVLRYREALRAGAATPDALRTAVASVGGPLSVSALCAALGFLAFAPTDYQGLAELGVISASGMVIAWFASLTLLPALLRLMPLRAVPPPPRTGPLWQARLQRLRTPLLLGAGIATLLSLATLPLLEFDFNPLHLKDPESESVATFLDLAGEAETSPYGIDVLAPDLAAAQGLAARLERLEVVDTAVTLASFVPRDQEEKQELIDTLAFTIGPLVDPPPEPAALTPEERRAALAELQAAAAKLDSPGAAGLVTALERLRERAPADAALSELEQRLVGGVPDLLEQLRVALDAGPVELEDLPASLRDAWLGQDGQARIQVQPAQPIADNESLRTFARAVLAEVPSATGTPVIITEAGRAVIEAFAQASGLALVLITGVLALVLRSLRDILLVLTPLALAVLLTAATAVLLGLQLNFANVIVLPLLFGLGVSSALHVVMRRRQQSDDLSLLASSTPRAVLFSALTTIASFGSLALSDHRGLASMGQLLTIAILWSLVCTLLVLPSMLSLVRSRPPRQDCP